MILTIAGCERFIDDSKISQGATGSELLSPAAARDTDWPALFGPELTSFSLESRLNLDWPAEGPAELWRKPIGLGYSSPVMANGMLTLLHRRGAEELISAYDAESGEPLWEHAYATRFKCRFPPYSDGPYGTPLIRGDLVYAVGAEAKLHCLRLESGEVVWHCDLAEKFGTPQGLFGFGAGLWIDDGKLFVNAGGVEQEAGIVALSAATGETIWTATAHPPAYTTPRIATIHGRKHLFVLTETGLASLDPVTGSERWTFPFHSRAVDTLNAVTPVVVDDRVLLVAGPGPGAVCLRILPSGEQEVIWKDKRVLDSQFNNLLVHQGFVYGFTSSQEGGAKFRCVRLADGKLMWTYASHLGRGSSVGADGRIILLGEQGHLGLVDLDPHKLTSRLLTEQPILAKPCYSAPAISRGRLYVRN